MVPGMHIDIDDSDSMMTDWNKRNAHKKLRPHQTTSHWGDTPSSFESPYVRATSTRTLVHSHLGLSPFLFSLPPVVLIVVTQIWSHAAGSPPPHPPPRTVHALHYFNARRLQPFFPRRLASNYAYVR